MALSLLVNHSAGQVNFEVERTTLVEEKNRHIGKCNFFEFDSNKYLYMK